MPPSNPLVSYSLSSRKLNFATDYCHYLHCSFLFTLSNHPLSTARTRLPGTAMSHPQSPQQKKFLLPSLPPSPGFFEQLGRKISQRFCRLVKTGECNYTWELNNKRNSVKTETLSDTLHLRESRKPLLIRPGLDF